MLYLILFLYQTTTTFQVEVDVLVLYLILFLYQTTTRPLPYLVPLVLYLILFLYQTTTAQVDVAFALGCILFCSYIKPQLG